MGEYAKYAGKPIKIGTCEQMYYLRADQVGKITPESGNVNPRLRSDAQAIRFRFPFPNEDGIEPGAFQDHEKVIGLWGIEPPEDVRHYSVQFAAQGGILCSLPCPESAEGKAAGIKFGYNGYSGKVGIHSQRFHEGKLKLVCRCGSCGSLWRYDTIEDCQPVFEALERESEREKRDRERRGEVVTGTYHGEIARRIRAGYEEPNFWTS